jgi:hypothetical protein
MESSPFICLRGPPSALPGSRWRVAAVAYSVADTQRRGTEKSQAMYYFTWDFLVEAMGLEPTNILTASDISDVHGRSFWAITAFLPGFSVQGGFKAVREDLSRCLHNCLHFLTGSRPTAPGLSRRHVCCRVRRSQVVPVPRRGKAEPDTSDETGEGKAK